MSVTLNVADALVQAYAYNEMVDGDNNKYISGGYPIQKMVNENKYIVQRGGTAITQDGYKLNGMENYAIPIGLVSPQPSQNTSIEYVGGRVQLDADDGVIPTELYNKLMDAVSVPVPYSNGGVTRKNKNSK